MIVWASIIIISQEVKSKEFSHAAVVMLRDVHPIYGLQASHVSLREPLTHHCSSEVEVRLWPS